MAQNRPITRATSISFFSLGGGSGRGGPGHTAGCGGSSYYGHPQVTSGSTESGSFTEGGAGQIGPAGQSDPLEIHQRCELESAG